MHLEEVFNDEVHHRLAMAIVHGSLPLKLHYEDRHAGILGVEPRYPFLDTEVVDFYFRLPESRLFGPESLGALIREDTLRVVGAKDRIPDSKAIMQTFEQSWNDPRFQEGIARFL